jgi:hypothetical protein
MGNTTLTADAKIYAREIMRRTPYSIYIIEKTEFNAMRKNPSAIFSILRMQSEEMGALGRTTLLFGR